MNNTYPIFEASNVVDWLKQVFKAENGHWMWFEDVLEDPNFFSDIYNKYHFSQFETVKKAAQLDGEDYSCILRWTPTGEYVRFEGWYSSYMSEYGQGHMQLVQPVTKTVTVFEPINNEDEGSY